MAIDQLLIERFYDTLAADASFTAVIPALSIGRSDGDTSRDVTPRCDIRAISDQPVEVCRSDGTMVTSFSGTVQLDLVLHKNNAYGAPANEHAGNMETCIDRMVALFHKQTLSISGFGLTTLVLETKGTGQESSETVRRYFIFRYNALTGSNRRLNGADITVEASSLGNRVILGFSEDDSSELLEDTAWTDCSRSFVAGRRLQRMTLLVATTSEAPLNIASGTELSGVTITRASSSYDVNLLVFAVRAAPVRFGVSDLDFTELSCMVNA